MYEEYNVFDLSYKIAEVVTAPSEAAIVDQELSSKIDHVEDLDRIYFYLRSDNRIPKVFPKTVNRTVSLLSESVHNKNNVNYLRFKRFERWLDSDTLARLAELWLEDTSGLNEQNFWVLKYVPRDTKYGLKALQKFTQIYKKHRSNTNIEIIEMLFTNIPKEDLLKACEIVSKSTPAVSSVLLSRNDIGEEYIVKGLKAISKLSKQKNIDIKIDFDMLERLGPRARLDAMKQLVGLCSGKKIGELPFKKVPDEDEVKKFLFPCAMKYNEEVKQLVDKFNELKLDRRKV